MEVASQFLCQNMRSDRQIKHKTKKDSTINDFIQTPLPIGLPLAIHSNVCEKILQNYTKPYIGMDNLKILSHVE